MEKLRETPIFLQFILIIFLLLACLVNDHHKQYISISRLTDPKNYASILDNLPDDVIEICKIA
jgi:hypothetical protein